MEGKKCDKPVHAPRGASAQRREGKKEAAGMYEASGPSDGQILTGLIEKEAKKLADKPKSTPRGPSVDIKDLKVSDLLSRYKSLMMKNKKA